MFWLISAGLVLLALAFVAWPLLRPEAAPRPTSVADRRSLMSAIYRDRMAELEAEAAMGQVDRRARDEVVEELGANLLDDYEQGVAAADARPRPAPSRSRLAGWLVVALMPVAALAVYLTVGEPDGPAVEGAAAVLRLDPSRQRAELEDWRERLSRRVARRPEEAQSWYLLGVTRLQLGEYLPAAQAFEEARELAGDDPTIDLYWLQARYLAAEGVLDERSRVIAESLLQEQPGNPLVLEMFAVDAFRRGEFRSAVEYLNRALNNPLAPEQRAALMSGLAEARARMGDLLPSVDVAVSAPDGAPREGVLFVIARPPGGGVPYAVVRRPAATLPVSVRLDDTVSMSPTLQLSDATELEVVVRLSRTGTPTAHPGDWEWRSEVLDLAELTAPLELDALLQPRGGRDG